MRIAIVGAGPAGSFCAYHLARAGCAVTLIDSHARAWEKPCGGGVPPKVRERFPEIMAYDGPRRSVGIGNFISPDGVPIRLESRAPMWIVSRRMFDGYLRGLAKDAGATFRHGSVRRVVRAKNGFVLQGDDEFACDFVIGADGAKSVVRRDLLGPIPSQLLATTVGYFVQAQETEARTWFLPQPGYVWAFPRTDHVCVGGGGSDAAADTWAAVERVRHDHFSGAKVLKKWSAPIPLVREPEFFDQPITGDGCAVIGDAAGHVDALTGEGILYALWGGQLLAQAILSHRLGDFEGRWRAEFGAELAKSATLSKWFYNPETISRVFNLANRSATMRRFLMDMMTDQPSYLVTGNMFLSRLPRIGVELVSSWLSY